MHPIFVEGPSRTTPPTQGPLQAMRLSACACLQGNRDCIGLSLAKLNYTATLATLLGTFHFKLTKEVGLRSLDWGWGIGWGRGAMEPGAACDQPACLACTLPACTGTECAGCRGVPSTHAVVAISSSWLPRCPILLHKWMAPVVWRKAGSCHRPRSCSLGRVCSPFAAPALPRRWRALGAWRTARSLRWRCTPPAGCTCTSPPVPP